jgi:hypothetical protein
LGQGRKTETEIENCRKERKEHKDANHGLRAGVADTDGHGFSDIEADEILEKPTEIELRRLQKGKNGSDGADGDHGNAEENQRLVTSSPTLYGCYARG